MSVKVEYDYKGIQPKRESVIMQGGGFLGNNRSCKTLEFTPVTISLTEDVDSDMATTIAEKLAEAEANGQPFVPMYIHSGGGCTYSLMSIVESIRQSNVPVYTIVTALAASAAACIFSCGKRRFMGRHAKLLLHDVSIDFGEESNMTTSNLKVEAKEMRDLNKKIFRIIAENTDNDPKFFADIVKGKRNNDIYVNGRQALKWKLATDVGYPVFKVTHTIDMVCEVRPSWGIKRQRLLEPDAEKDEVVGVSSQPVPKKRKREEKKEEKVARVITTRSKAKTVKKKRKKKEQVEVEVEDEDTDNGENGNWDEWDVGSSSEEDSDASSASDSE
jgi:ATP-dependent Clp protease protease subunit